MAGTLARKILRAYSLTTSFSAGGGNDDFARYSSLMWLRDGNRGTQSLNFQGHGVSPWLQPRIDSPLLGLKPDTYQQMAAAALEEIRYGDPSKQHPATLQYQQTHNLNSGLNSLFASHVLGQVQFQPQQSPLQVVQQGHCQNTGDSGFLQGQLPRLQLHNTQQLLKEQELQQQQRQHVLQEQSSQ